MLPDGLATEIDRNSEGVALALLFAVWLHLVRPRLGRSPWRATGLASIGCVAGALLLLASDWTDHLRTLNEALLAAGMLLLYSAVARPLPRWAPYSIVAAVLGLNASVASTEFGRTLAEALAVAILAPVALDVVEPQLLDSDAPRSPPGVRVMWYLAIAAFPVVMQGVDDSVTEGVAGTVIRYSSRTTEAFVFVLLLGACAHLVPTPSVSAAGVE